LALPASLRQAKTGSGKGAGAGEVALARSPDPGEIREQSLVPLRGTLPHVTIGSGVGNLPMRMGWRHGLETHIAAFSKQRFMLGTSTQSHEK